jgi:hypothetical protein
MFVVQPLNSGVVAFAAFGARAPAHWPYRMCAASSRTGYTKIVAQLRFSFLPSPPRLFILQPARISTVLCITLCISGSHRRRTQK